MARRRRRSSISIAVSLPIIPMLDMTFQLLFFLILTFKPDSVKEAEFKLEAPGGAAAGPVGGADPGDEPGKLTVVVRSLPDGSGGMSALVVQSLAGEWAVADLGELGQFLRTRRQETARASPVRLKADSKLKYAFVMDVLDVCHEAGYKQVGFAGPDS